MKFLFLRTKFLNRFLIDGKKYNAVNILNNVFYYLISRLFAFEIHAICYLATWQNIKIIKTVLVVY